MQYLIDTHVALWWLADPKKISLKARKIISDRKNKVFISSISFWEMAIKHDLGKLTLPRNIIELLSSEGFDIITLRAEEGLSVVDLPKIHNDPFDRILISQAKYNDLIFITKDKKIFNYPITTIKA
jgi:PIN domain nuclease of toxin-antitoxin system